jgi:hypothetical protein
VRAEVARVQLHVPLQDYVEEHPRRPAAAAAAAVGSELVLSPSRLIDGWLAP